MSPLAGSASDIVSSHLHDALSRRFFRLAEIQERVEVRTSGGGITYTWAAVEGMEAVPCNRVEQQPSETRSAELIETIDLCTFLLNGVYPRITPQCRLRLDDGSLYDVQGQVTDSLSGFSKVVARAITPVAEAGV